MADATHEDSWEPQVVVGGESGLAQAIRAGRHRLRADEPVAAGGSDSGPDPYSLLLAALGACTAMTARMYAERKQWPLEDVEVALRHDRLHAADCAQCETREGKIDRISLRLSFQGALDETQRTRLAEIAGHCPVHRTLQSETRIETTVQHPSVHLEA